MAQRKQIFIRSKTNRGGNQEEKTGNTSIPRKKQKTGIREGTRGKENQKLWKRKRQADPYRKNNQNQAPKVNQKSKRKTKEKKDPTPNPERRKLT